MSSKFVEFLMLLQHYQVLGLQSDYFLLY